MGLSYVSGTSGIVNSLGGTPINVMDLGGGMFSLDTLPILDEVQIQLTLAIDANFTGDLLTNYAEISDFTNEYGLDDVDSTPDGTDGNDFGGSPNSDADNTIDGNGMGMVGDGVASTDEDDHDPAQVQIQEVDLALMKKIDNSFNGEPIAVGELLKFDIIVINQGDISVDSVVVVDYVPAGLSFDVNEPLNIAAGWRSDITTTLLNTINPGERDTVSIYLTALFSTNPADYINTSEITAAYDTLTGRDIAPFDVDSDPDSNTANENNTTPDSSGDNNISSTSNGGTGSEDDHDVEAVEVVYPDVALRKILAPNTDLTNLDYGDAVRFIITIINQGTMDADSIEVTDYLPAGLSFDASIPANSNWMALNDSTIVTHVSPLIANSQKQVSVWLRVNHSDNQDDWINVAEISQFIDEKGIDRSDEDLDSDLNDDRTDNSGGQSESAADNEI